MQVRQCLKHESRVSLLTPSQMVQLTGRRKKSLQVQWLKHNKIPFYVNAEGYPQVLETMLPTADLSDFELGEVR
jgi:hypothetical protein